LVILHYIYSAWQFSELPQKLPNLLKTLLLAIAKKVKNPCKNLRLRCLSSLITRTHPKLFIGRMELGHI
jgi:hypothetical protein